MKKKCILVTLIITLLMNSIIVIPINSIAAIEEGMFSKWEAPYNIKIIKVVEDRNGLYGGKSSYMLDEEGRLWESEEGEVGLTHIFESYRFTDIASGKKHSLAIDSEGYLFAWGDNTYGQLGNGTTDGSSKPIEILPTKQFKSVICSENASFAIDKNGDLYAWGSNKFGESYSNDSVTETFNGQTYKNTVGIGKIPKLKLANVEKVCANRDSILAIDKEGYAWGWGDNTYGQLGNYDTAELTKKAYYSGMGNSDYFYVKNPTKISETIKFKDISVGNLHSVLLSDNGIAYTVGVNGDGQLGIGDTSAKKNTLTTPLGLEEIKIEKVLAGFGYSAFMDENHNIWTCGDNSFGTLGNGTTTDSATIVRVKKNAEITFVDFAIPSPKYNIFVFDSNGDLWGWGGNDESQLAIAGTRVTSPVQITKKINEYTVTFKNGETIEKTEKVIQGESATAPELSKAGYTLSWDTDFSNVTTDLTVNAVWTANTNTAYKVIHHFRNLDTEVEGFIDEEEQKIGTTDTQGVAEYKTKEGFTKNESDTRTVKQGNIAGDGSLVLHLYYTRNTYDIIYELNEGKETSPLTNSYIYGKEMILSNRVEKEGYTFAGWYDNSEFNGSPITAIPVGATGEKTFYAKWDAKGDTPYKVQHYKQKQDLSGYELTEEEPKTGITGANVTAIPKVYKGYIENTTHNERKPQGTILPDGSLVLKLYYDVNEYTVTFKNGETVEKTEKVIQGESATAPELNRIGYTLTWDKKFDNVTTNLEVNAIWIPNTNTAYKVEHYVRSLDTEVEGYDLRETENKTGTTDTTVTAIYKEYEGFTKDENNIRKIESGNIAGNGSLVLKVYYSRNSYSITYELNGGEETSPLTNSYIYGKEMVLSNRVTKEGYKFAGWYDNSEFGGNSITAIPATATGEKTFYAKWVEKDKEYYILSERYSIDLEGKTITKVSPETTVENFLTKIETNGTCKVLNTNGQEVSKNTLVGTGYKLQVTFEGQVYTYEIAVRGDIDGNGKLTITDLSMLNQALMEKITLTGIKEKAADIDYNEDLTITDLSMLNQALMEKIIL